MSPLIPKGPRRWQDDPAHAGESPGPPPTETEPPREQEDLGPEVSMPAEPRGTGETIKPEVEPVFEPEDERDPAPVPDINEVDVPEELEKTIRAAMARYPEKRSASIPALWAVQRAYGWCTPEGIVQAAAVMEVTPGYLQSVASFYDLFHLEPRGDHEVLVCTNISCWLRGADDVLAAMQEAAPDSVSVRGFECLGACDIAPMASIDERYYGPLETGDAAEVMRQLTGDGDVLPSKRLADRPAAGGKDGTSA